MACPDAKLRGVSFQLGERVSPLRLHDWCFRWVLVGLVALAPRVSAEATSELIFPLQGKHVHGSTIVEGPNGDLLAAWFHGSGERSANDVQIQGARLKKGANAWGPVFVMADTPDIPDCNPSLYVDARNRVWLFWIVVHNNRWERSMLKYRRADSFGSKGAPDWDWQDVILLNPGEDFGERIEQGLAELGLEEGMWAEYALPYAQLLSEAAQDPVKRDIGWMTRARPVTLPTGRILLPLYSDGFNASLMAISDDLGETWRASKPIIGLGPIQPTLARRKNGEIVALCRDSGGAPARVMASESADEGETWSLARDTDLPNPGSSLAVVTLADGRWLLVYNDTEEGRHSLAVALSDDEGQSWPWKRHLERAEPDGGSFSYPTCFQAGNGTVHVSFSYRVKDGASIEHAAFDPDWVLGK